MKDRHTGVAARELCMAFPETEEVMSHGRPNYRVGGKAFAIYSLNHHGDGHVALLLKAPPGTQELYTEMEPAHYYVPAYVGARGWLGVEMQSGLSWSSVVTRVWEAWRDVAPAVLRDDLPDPPTVPGPRRMLRPEEIDPFLGERARQVMARLDQFCAGLPETSRTAQFGSPVWKAGKKTFTGGAFRRGRLQLQFWVGVERQAMLCIDPRFSIPPYIGGNGWIQLDVDEHVHWAEVEQLLLDSYRHFALKRMLKAM